MSDTYTLTLEQEILCEQAANIIADLCNYIRQHKIDINEKTPITVMIRAITNLKHDLLQCKTMEELLVVRGQFIFAENCLKSLEA